MKVTGRIAAFASASCGVMVLVDFILGEKAEFLNAYSVMQRLLTVEPSSGRSFVARQYGDIGELVAVVLANLLIGVIAAALVSTLKRSANDAT